MAVPSQHRCHAPVAIVFVLQTNVLDGGYGNVTFSYITDVELNKTETILFPIEITGAENEFDTMTITNAFKESFGTKFNEVSKINIHIYVRSFT